MTTITEYNKGGACQCRNHNCKKVFHQNDVKRIHTESYGQQVTESVCPYCGSKFGLLVYPATEEKLIYNSNFPSELKIHMDQVTEEIIDKDIKLYKAKKKAERINKKYLERYGLL